MPMNLLSARDRLCLEREERVTARLQCWHQRDQEQRSDQTKVRQTRLDRRRVRRAAEQPTAMQTRLATDHTSTSRWNTAYQTGWHISIACPYLHTFLTLKKNSHTHVNGEWIVHVGVCLTRCVTSLISDMIFLYQFTQACPHNVLVYNYRNIFVTVLFKASNDFVVVL